MIGCCAALMSPTVSDCFFFLKEDGNRTNNVSDTNARSDCRLGLLERTNFKLTVINKFDIATGGSYYGSSNTIYV